ncbi:MAG: hypothetical protein JNK82_06275 [Myxococcaceae bacterium]|nr:hypothetical protein [Myxococcaceae bacterium]
MAPLASNAVTPPFRTASSTAAAENGTTAGPAEAHCDSPLEHLTSPLCEMAQVVSQSDDRPCMPSSQSTACGGLVT